MKLAEIPQAAIEPAREFLDQYLSGLGRDRLLRDPEDASRISARGALKEAALGLQDLDEYLRATPESFEGFYDRLRLFLFYDEHPVGTMSLYRDAGWTPESVVLGGVEEISAAIARAEQMSESAGCEARILRIAQLYTEALVVVADSTPVAYFSIAPPYTDELGPVEPRQYGEFLRGLVRRHREVFEDIRR